MAMGVAELKAEVAAAGGMGLASSGGFGRGGALAEMPEIHQVRRGGGEKMGIWMGERERERDK
jgi:hypothetical protein